jgi:energy-coupling factor transporter ATP-binding protein EcfA2
MSAEQVSLLAEKAVFRPRSRLWELHDLHIPFDELADSSVYEQRAITRITEGSCVAVIGPSGAGKSSVIAWLCYQLPSSHFALRIPVTGVNDPGNVGEIARLTLSIALDEIILDASEEKELQKAHATSQMTVHKPAGISAKLGGGVIPGEVNVNVASLRQQFTDNRLGGDYLLALNGRLVPILADAGRTPVFVFEDTEATVGGPNDRDRAEAFFAGPLSAFVDQVDAPTLVAVQTHLTQGSRAFGRLAPGLERLTIPLLSELARRSIEAILSRRTELAELRVQITDIIESSALDELAAFYRQTGGDLRRVLAAAHEATEHAAADGAGLIALPHVRFGIAQWQ